MLHAEVAWPHAAVVVRSIVCLDGPVITAAYLVPLAFAPLQGVIDGKVARHLRSEPVPAEPNPNAADGDFVKARQCSPCAQLTALTAVQQATHT